MPTFEELAGLMETAQAAADVVVTEALESVRDGYVLAGQAHVAAETAWLGAPDDMTLAAIAQGTWVAVVDARTALTDAMTAAETVRRASLATAWETIRAEDVDP